MNNVLMENPIQKETCLLFDGTMDTLRTFKLLS